MGALLMSSYQPSSHHHYRAPRTCPVCSERLRVTQLGCDACGTGLSGDFEQCEFCALDAADRDVLRVFLASRGNIRELERHLSVSYPTARARFDELVRKLGLVTRPDAETPDPAPLSRPEPTPDPRLAALNALAAGELDVEQARRLLSTE
jgi:hypothetical protein